MVKEGTGLRRHAAVRATACQRTARCKTPPRLYFHPAAARSTGPHLTRGRTSPTVRGVQGPIPSRRNCSDEPSSFHRGLCVAAALLVVLLGVLSVSPVAHAALHAGQPGHHPDGDHTHHCVVTAFAAGEAWYVPPAPLPVLPAPVAAQVTAARPGPELSPVAARLQPACGPPV